MKPFAVAALCAGLAAAPLVAKAADLVLFDASGSPVAVLVPEAAAIPSGLLQQQDAVLDHMTQSMRDMEAAFSASTLPLDPAGFGRLQTGAAVVTTSFSDGRNSCSRTITYKQRDGGGPLVQVRQTGDACGELFPGAEPGSVPVALPEDATPQRVVPHDNPSSPKLIRVDYRHPVGKPHPTRG